MYTRSSDDAAADGVENGSITAEAVHLDQATGEARPSVSQYGTAGPLP